MIEAAKRLTNVGEYYFSKKLDEIRAMNAKGDNVLNLGIGSPDLPPSDEVINTLKKDAVNAGAHGYQSYRSIETLRNAMSQFYKKYFKVELNAKNEILPLLGSKEGVMYVSMAFLNPEDVVLVPNPGYPAYETAAKLMGAQVVRYDLDQHRNWEPDLVSIDAEILKRTKLMWINYPNMPTGSKGSDKMYNDIVNSAREHDFLVCNDNPYSFILNDEYKSALQFDPSMKNCMELNSLSKTYNMAGWRVGMLCGHEAYINTVLKVKSNVDSGMFKPVQEAAAQALLMSEEWIKKNNEVYKIRRKLAADLLKELGCDFDMKQSGMFLWAKIPAGQKSVDFVDEILYGSRVFITPGTVFGSNGEGYVRISLCSPDSYFEEAIMRIKSVLST